MTDRSKPLLFISHKHSDSKIADVIRSFVTLHTGNRVEVFQSSSPWADAPKAGRNLNKQLRETLWKANVVILIYTSQDQDWTYCMWECGVASHPQSPETNIILFQCGGSSPAVFAEQVNINARDAGDIQKFTDQLLTDSDFFPAYGGPITEFVPHGQDIARIAANFCKELEAVLPPLTESFVDDWPAFPFLQLELDFKDIEPIISSGQENNDKSSYVNILEQCKISSADNYCPPLFGMMSFPQNMRLEELFNRWKEKFPNSQSRWIKALCDQVLNGARWEFPKSILAPLSGLNDGNWYASVLLRVRKIHSRQCMQFDIYFYKFDVEPQKTSFEVDFVK